MHWLCAKEPREVALSEEPSVALSEEPSVALLSALAEQ